MTSNRPFSSQYIHSTFTVCQSIDLVLPSFLDSGNYVFEEIMNSLTHGLGFIASVVGTILLMSAAAAPGTSPYHFWSCMIFSLSLMVLYLSSTLYHR